MLYLGTQKYCQAIAAHFQQFKKANPLDMKFVGFSHNSSCHNECPL